jgi:cytochrome c553
MKLIKLLLVIAAAAAMTLALGGNASAFHGDGVAYCSGCHTMHNSQDGQPVAPEGATGDYLLRQVDGSSTCLRCHAEYGQRTETGNGYGAGGDFYWLTKTYTWESHGAKESTGDSHGHNIIAADFGLLTSDAKLLNKAPGGTFDHELSCASCHDPHGNGNYNLLRGLESHDGANFPEAPIVSGTGRLTVPKTVNSRSNPEEDTNHVVYGSGMSRWCAACHTDFFDGARMHPADAPMNTTLRDNYNGYISTDNPTGGSSTTAYTTLVPFQTGARDLALLPDNNSTEGPSSGAQVACISCHRAHATAFPDIGRWFFDTENLTDDSHPKVGDSGLGVDDVVNSYYGRSIAERFPAAEQRSLCNKCHVKDLNSGSHGG